MPERPRPQVSGAFPVSRHDRAGDATVPARALVLPRVIAFAAGADDSCGMQADRWFFPCPCCGYLVFEHQPGHHERCPICQWEDDLAQLRFPRMPGSANHVSLEDAQHNFADCGAAERRNVGLTRRPFDSESREAGWRPLDPARDNIEEPQRDVNYGDSYPLADTTVLYYWRATYWRRIAG